MDTSAGIQTACDGGRKQKKRRSREKLRDEGYGLAGGEIMKRKECDRGAHCCKAGDGDGFAGPVRAKGLVWVLGLR